MGEIMSGLVFVDRAILGGRAVAFAPLCPRAKGRRCPHWLLRSWPPHSAMQGAWDWSPAPPQASSSLFSLLAVCTHPYEHVS